MMTRGGVLVTRPEPGLSETMTDVEQAGWRAYASPALKIFQRAPQPLSFSPVGIILTSGQAVDGASEIISDMTLPVYAVGDRTAQKAKAAGFLCVYSAQGNADSLVALLKTMVDPASGILLFLAGGGQGRELLTSLHAEGFNVIRRATYAALPVRGIAQSVVQALSDGEISYILFFSAESARSWLCALPPFVVPTVKKITALAISEKTADVLAAMGWSHIKVAQTPDAKAMLALLSQEITH